MMGHSGVRIEFYEWSNGIRTISTYFPEEISEVTETWSNIHSKCHQHSRLSQHFPNRTFRFNLVTHPPNKSMRIVAECVFPAHSSVYASRWIILHTILLWLRVYNRTHFISASSIRIRMICPFQCQHALIIRIAPLCEIFTRSCVRSSLFTQA